MADIQDLIGLNFIEIGECRLIDNGAFDVNFNFEKDKNIGARNVLYAFVSILDNFNSEVKYIGKTTKGIETRMSQYKAGHGTSTNNRIKRYIIDLLVKKESIRIFILTDIPALQWGGYNLNLPAGLEDSLIYCFKPEWNNTHGIPKTTLADFEDELKTEINVNNSATKPVCDSPCGVFNWTLGNTYFNQGFMNPGVSVDHCFGEKGDLATLEFPDGTQFEALINRSANRNGTVRLHFTNVVGYLKEHYKLGEVMAIQICANNKLVVL